MHPESAGPRNAWTTHKLTRGPTGRRRTPTRSRQCLEKRCQTDSWQGTFSHVCHLANVTSSRGTNFTSGNGSGTLAVYNRAIYCYVRVSDSALARSSRGRKRIQGQVAFRRTKGADYVPFHFFVLVEEDPTAGSLLVFIYQ